MISFVCSLYTIAIVKNEKNLVLIQVSSFSSIFFFWHFFLKPWDQNKKVLVQRDLPCWLLREAEENHALTIWRYTICFPYQS